MPGISSWIPYAPKGVKRFDDDDDDDDDDGVHTVVLCVGVVGNNGEVFHSLHSP